LITLLRRLDTVIRAAPIPRFLSVAILAAALAAPPAEAANGDGSYDIGYIWTPFLQGALDYREMVAEQLGDDVERHLQVVQGGSGNYGVIYDRSGTDSGVAREVANAHHDLLRRAFGGKDLLADVLRDKGFERLHHVRICATDDPAACETHFQAVSDALPGDVARALVVQRASDGQYELVWQLWFLHADADAALAAHVDALEGLGLAPEVAMAGNAAVLRDSSTATKAPAPEPDEPEPDEPEPDEPEPEEPEPEEPEPDEPSPPVSEDSTLRFDLMDRDLRNAVNERVQALRGKGEVARDERTAWVVYDLADDRTLMAINWDTPLQCASMVKPLVALAFFHEVERGRFIYGPRSKANLEAMMQRSSNDATNWFIDQIGGPGRVQTILEDHYGELVPHVSIVEKIPPGGGTYRNKASAEDYARFLRALWRDELPHADEVKRAMNLPNGDRIYKSVPQIPAGTAVYDKTGTTSRLVGDMGILVARDAQGADVPYVFVGIVEKSRKHPSLYQFARSRGDVIREVSGLVYDELKTDRNLR